MKKSLYLYLIVFLLSCVTVRVQKKQEYVVNQNKKKLLVDREIYEKPEVRVFVVSERNGKKVKKDVTNSDKVDVAIRKYHNKLKIYSYEKLLELLKEEKNVDNIAIILDVLTYKKLFSLKVLAPFLDDRRVINQELFFFPYIKWVNGNSNGKADLQPIELRVYVSYLFFIISNEKVSNVIFNNHKSLLYAQNRVTKKGVKKEDLCRIWKNWYKNRQNIL